MIGVGFDNLISGFKTTNQKIDNDTSNLDSSSSTDKFVRIDWDVKDGKSAAVDTWTGHNKADLLKFNLKVISLSTLNVFLCFTKTVIVLVSLFQ